MNNDLRKIAVDMTNRFGFCAMKVTEAGSYILPMDDSFFALTKEAQNEVASMIKRLRKREDETPTKGVRE